MKLLNFISLIFGPKPVTDVSLRPQEKMLIIKKKQGGKNKI